MQDLGGGFAFQPRAEVALLDCSADETRGVFSRGLSLRLSSVLGSSRGED
jgi:hypothetical protein